MKYLLKPISVALLCVMSLVTAISCMDDSGKQPTTIGNTICVPNELDAIVTAKVEFTSAWELNNKDNNWFTVSPLAGEAGVNELEIKVLEENPDMREKVSSFIVYTSDDVIEYFVIQDPVEGLVVKKSSFSTIKAGIEVSVSVEGNIPYTASTEDSWLTVGEIEYDEPAVLDDKQTNSRYVSSAFSVTIPENTGDIRTGKVVITDENGQTYDVTLMQNGKNVTPDYGKTFIRRSVAMRFTSNQCVYCPGMNKAIMAAAEEYENHIIPVNFYGNMGSSKLIYSGTSAFMSEFGYNGFPSGCVNYYIDVPNWADATALKDAFKYAAEEATNELPSNTMIAGECVIVDDNLTLKASIASKAAGEYQLCAFVLEDGLEASQSGGGKNYIHDNVVMTHVKARKGEPVSVGANAVLEYTLSIPMSNIRNILHHADDNNLKMVVWLMRTGSYKGSIKDYVYYRDFGYVIDNAVVVPVNGFASFEYEN